MRADNMKKMKNLITRDTPIGEIAANYTKPIEILMSYGFHCIGCGASEFESVSAGASVHGLDDEAIDTLVKELNGAANEEVAKKAKGNGKKSKKDACECAQEIIILKLAAADRIKEMMKAEGKDGWGLRLTSAQTPRGDYDYELDFERAQKKGDLSVKVEGGLLVFFEKRLEKTVSGIIIDYKKGSKSGEDIFTMKKETAHACGCG